MFHGLHNLCIYMKVKIKSSNYIYLMVTESVTIIYSLPSRCVSDIMIQKWKTDHMSILNSTKYRRLLVTNLNIYLFSIFQAKQRASIKWLLSKAYEHKTPAELREPFYKDNDVSFMLIGISIQYLSDFRPKL